MRRDLNFYIDGVCRGSGHDERIGASAACSPHRTPGEIKTEYLDTWRHPATSKRAKILGAIIALKWALKEIENSDSPSDISVVIYSDFRFLINWLQNPRLDSERQDRDLLDIARRLDLRIRKYCDLDYVEISKASNKVANKACKEALDELENNFQCSK
ncbi:hypothetical protein K449DRAFT_198295 [Hypoxylon sp. EC38]|nr:hypothetical protein K449DRAFT_198295 [Hypoxylon sp. EC38]